MSSPNAGPAWGDPDPWQRLEESAREVIRTEPSFQKVLANDCLSELPPLTFFQDAVVDESGERTEVFALQLRALGPIVEVGRVFGIANQRVLGSSTTSGPSSVSPGRRSARR